jgi:opacity protein-like surface antigen
MKINFVYFLVFLGFIHTTLHANEPNWKGLQVETILNYQLTHSSNGDLYGTSSGGIESLQNSVTSSSKNSFNWTIGGGYGFALTEKALLILGLDYLPQNRDSSSFSVGVDSAHYTYSNQLNIYAAPGWHLTSNNLIFTKIGYSQINVKGHGTNPFDDIGNPSKSLQGYVLGLGVKHHLKNNFYFVGEYSYTTFSKSKLSGYDSNTSLTDWIKTGLTKQSISLGIGTRF